MVSYSVLVAVAALAFILGVVASRRRQSSTSVIWEAPRDSAAHDAAIADPEVLDLLSRKQLIAAIKRYRDLTGAGLKESKDAVEALQRSMARG